MKQFLFLILLVQSFYAWAQIGLPIRQSVLPKNSLVVDYDFSKSSSFSRASSTVTNLAGTASGNATLASSPFFMNSLGFVSFNGSTQYLVTQNLKSYFKSVNSSIQKSFTMCFWFYPTATSGVLVSELDSQTPNEGWHASNIELVNGVINFRVYSSTTPVQSSAVNLNQWYHVAMVYDGTSFKGYLNGVLQGSQAFARVIPTASQNYAIGAGETTSIGATAYGKFNLAQFKMYNLPLSDKDVALDYDTRKSEFDYTIHSPSTNTNPTYWAVSSAWNSSSGSTGASDAFAAGHYDPWLNSNLGWAAQANNTSQFITLNYDEPVNIKGIVTQGRANSGNQWVKTAHIETSLNGVNFTRLLTSNAINSVATDDNFIKFTNPVFAKYVKVIPTDWNNHITMRMGMLVKKNDIANDGLLLRLDPSNLKSYGGTGTTLNDLTSNAINFTLVGTPVFDANGFFTFNGTNQYLSRAHTNTIKPTTAITIEQWLKADDWNAGTSSTNYKCALSCTSGGGYSHNIWSGAFYSYIFAGGRYLTPSVSVSNLTGWQHFVTTFDGRYARLYMNGVLVDTKDYGSSNTTMSYASNSILIGAEASAGTSPEGDYWQGKISNTLIYNRALSDSEILTNYNSTKFRHDGLVLKLDAANLNSYVGSGSTWNDLSGNGNNATLTNGPVFNSNNGGQIVLDGVNDFVNGVSIPATSGNNSRTVIVWYKSTANKNTILLDKGEVVDDKSEQLFLINSNSVGVGAGSYPPTNNGGIGVCFWGNDFIYPISASTLFDGNWHFVAYTYNNTNRSVNICFDGVFASTVYQWNTSAWSTLNSKPFISPRVLNTTNNPYFVGQSRAAFWGYGGLYSNVTIPSIYIYDRSLSESEILNIYNSTRSRF